MNKATKGNSSNKTKKTSPGLAGVAKDLPKKSSDAGYGMEQHKEVKKLKQEVQKLQKKIQAMEKKTAPKPRKK